MESQLNTSKSKPIDKYSDRRLMPRVIIPKNLLQLSGKSIMVSGDLNYFIKYGIPLINSHLKHKLDTNLIINCVDFQLSTANSILNKYFPTKSTERVFLIKTDFSNFIFVDPERKQSYLKTIRFYVAKLLRSKCNIPLIVTDIDALITSNKFDDEYSSLISSQTTFGVGSQFNFINDSFFKSAKFNYPWRTVKAGFTYFAIGSAGFLAISRIVDNLFNITDPIPPIEELKLYRAYYGDQLAIIFTALEFNSAPQEVGHKVTCIVSNENKILSFGSDPNIGYMWIPPASKRNEAQFTLEFDNQEPKALDF